MTTTATAPRDRAQEAKAFDLARSILARQKAIAAERKGAK